MNYETRERGRRKKEDVGGRGVVKGKEVRKERDEEG